MMPRNYTRLVVGRGHQSPPFETWASDIGADEIPVLRTLASVDDFESNNHCTCPPALVIAYAIANGLSVNEQQSNDLLALRKAWRDHKALPEPGPPPSTFHIGLSVYPPEGGSITPPSGDFPLGHLLLTAKPNADYIFERWSGDYTGTDSRTTIIVDSNKSITAHFEQKVASE